ncbi:MAG: hypothetical protein AAFR17_11130 [Pseudomonadota bacterium]
MRIEQVPMSELRAAANAVFDATERRGVSEIAVDGALYHVIDSEAAFDLVTPPALMVGDTLDDLDDLRRDLGLDFDDQDRADVVWHTLDHLIGLLTQVSAELKGRRFGVGGGG